MRKNIASALILAIYFVLLCVIPVRAYAEDEYSYAAFFADDEETARGVASYVHAEFIAFNNGIAQIRTKKNEYDASIESELPEEFIFYPDILYVEEILETEDLESSQWYLGAIGADEAWSVSKGSGVKVAVIDSGIDSSHEDLSSGIILAKTAIPDEAYTTEKLFPQEYKGAMDNAGHGTHVAGIIGARDNNIGITGIAPECSIISIKATEKSGSRTIGRTSWITAAIREAVLNGADIINLSLGGSAVTDQMLKQVIDEAVDSGIVVVCAAGNTNGVSTVMYPAAYESVIAVSACKQSGDSMVFASYSNYGSFVDICAPGSGMLSTVPGGYAQKDGTSMACPVVSGAIADLLAADSTLSVNKIKNMLYNSASDAGNPGKDVKYGNGIINMAKLLEPYSENPIIGTVSSDVFDGGSISEGENVVFTTNTLGADIVYTTDETDPDASSNKASADGVMIEQANGSITFKAACLSVKGTVGSVSTYTYSVIPGVSEISGGDELSLEKIADKAMADPVVDAPCRRYHIVIPQEKSIKIRVEGINSDVSVLLFDRAGSDGMTIGNLSNSVLIYNNKALYDKDVWISVIDNDGENLNNSCSFNISVVIDEIEEEKKKPSDDSSDDETAGSDTAYRPVTTDDSGKDNAGYSENADDEDMSDEDMSNDDTPNNDSSDYAVSDNGESGGSGSDTGVPSANAGEENILYGFNGSGVLTNDNNIAKSDKKSASDSIRMEGSKEKIEEKKIEENKDNVPKKEADEELIRDETASEDANSESLYETKTNASDNLMHSENERGLLQKLFQGKRSILFIVLGIFLCIAIVIYIIIFIRNKKRENNAEMQKIREEDK